MHQSITSIKLHNCSPFHDVMGVLPSPWRLILWHPRPPAILIGISRRRPALLAIARPSAAALLLFPARLPPLLPPLLPPFLLLLLLLLLLLRRLLLLLRRRFPQVVAQLPRRTSRGGTVIRG